MLMVVSSSVWPSRRWKVSWRVRLTSKRWSQGAAMAVPVAVMRRVASVVCLAGHHLLELVGGLVRHPVVDGGGGRVGIGAEVDQPHPGAEPTGELVEEAGFHVGVELAPHRHRDLDGDVPLADVVLAVAVAAVDLLGEGVEPGIQLVGIGRRAARRPAARRSPRRRRRPPRPGPATRRRGRSRSCWSSRASWWYRSVPELGVGGHDGRRGAAVDGRPTGRRPHLGPAGGAGAGGQAQAQGQRQRAPAQATGSGAGFRAEMADHDPLQHDRRGSPRCTPPA